jgi:hypothetical protein
MYRAPLLLRIEPPSLAKPRSIPPGPRIRPADSQWIQGVRGDRDRNLVRIRFSCRGRRKRFITPKGVRTVYARWSMVKPSQSMLIALRES